MAVHTILVDEPNPELSDPMVDFLRNRRGRFLLSQSVPSPRGITPTRGRWARNVSLKWFPARNDRQVQRAAERLANGGVPGSDNPRLLVTHREALAEGVNGLTRQGFRVCLDEARNGGRAAKIIARALPMLEHPERVYVFAVDGPGIAYRNLEKITDPPLFETALELGVNLMPEMYVQIAETEKEANKKSRDITWEEACIEWVHGKNRRKLGWLADRWRAKPTRSKVHPILGIHDRWRREGSKVGAPLLDRDLLVAIQIVVDTLVMNYPEFVRHGIGTHKWQSVTRPGSPASLTGPDIETWAPRIAAMIERAEARVRS